VASLFIYFMRVLLVFIAIGFEQTIQHSVCVGKPAMRQNVEVFDSGI